MAPASLSQAPSPSPTLLSLTLTSSSSIFTSSSPTTLADTTQTASTGTSPATQRGANYFFGFLITFVALLLIFVGCGVSSRRRFAARRRAVLAAAAARPADDGKPRVWDVWVPPEKAAHLWERGPDWDKITPLAARTVHLDAIKAAEAAAASSSTLFLPESVVGTRAPTPVLVEPPLISLDLLVPEWVLRRREMRAAGLLDGKGRKKGKKGKEVKETRMQVTVLVAMPAPRQVQAQKHEKAEEEEGPGHVEIGVASVPWRGEEDDEDDEDGKQ
ncbi:hypothetical protein BD779DRAFT_1800155 [Infundibulicybe gibba]|nr:hypothetical protein BD779DRAFT_1800155 [Infundibulicybe gibba]